MVEKMDMLHIRKLVFEVTWYGDFFYPINTFASGFFFQRDGGVLSPVLEGRFRKERRKETVLLYHRMVSE
jgi:hypothetical protein